MNTPSCVGPSADRPTASHDALIQDQFSRQAALFAGSPELHNEAQIALLVESAAPTAADEALDVACGPGTVVAGFAGRVRRAVGLDATDAMLTEARKLAGERQIDNVAWHRGDVYDLPFADRSFDIVSCRYAVHHFEQPAKAFTEMTRVCRSGGRIVLCDGIASNDPGKAAAFNAMERHRDPSTVAFRTLPFLVELFAAAGLPSPRVAPFHVTYERDELVAKSFPADDDRVRLREQIDALIATDAMDAGTRPGDTMFVYPAAVLVALKP